MVQTLVERFAVSLDLRFDNQDSLHRLVRFLAELLPARFFQRSISSYECENFTARADIGNPHSVTFKLREGFPGLVRAHGRHPVVKLHEKLRDRYFLLNDFFNDLVFGAFDIHLEDVDPAVPLKLHRRGKPDDWEAQIRAPVLWRLNYGVGNPVFLRRKIKRFFAIVPSDPRVMKMELPRQGLRRKPLFNLGSRIERVNLDAETSDKRQIEGNVFANSQRIDNRVVANHRTVQ